MKQSAVTTGSVSSSLDKLLSRSSRCFPSQKSVGPPLDSCTSSTRLSKVKNNDLRLLAGQKKKVVQALYESIVHGSARFGYGGHLNVFPPISAIIVEHRVGCNVLGCGYKQKLAGRECTTFVQVLVSVSVCDLIRAAMTSSILLQIASLITQTRVDT